MTNRRFLRLGNDFSKRIEALRASTNLDNLYYNYCRPHMSLPRCTTPAMAAGLATHPYDALWLSDMVEASYPKLRKGKTPGPKPGSKRRKRRDFNYDLIH